MAEEAGSNSMDVLSANLQENESVQKAPNRPVRKEHRSPAAEFSGWLRVPDDFAFSRGRVQENVRHMI
jgi:hypothetical protein